MGALPDFPAHMESVLVRQVDVQQNRVCPGTKRKLCYIMKIVTALTLKTIFFKN